MSGPRTKRQFAGAASDPSQRSITSFFTRTSSSTTAADVASKNASHGALSGPVIPPQVQTDLLNVGMRVRKAIPEGYKTGSAYSAFTLWADESTGDPVKPQPTATTSGAAFTSTIRELEPFCGLNKVGGLAFQPAYYPNSRSVTTASVADVDDLNAMPGLTSSQDTIASTTSFVSTATAGYGTLNITTTDSTTTSLPPRKRFYTSDEEEAAHSAQITTLPYRGPVRLSSDSQEAWLDEEISPRSLAPPPGLWENARVLAVPRRSKQNQQTGRKSLGAVGQENVMVVVRDGGQDGNDFEEAAFLDYGLTGTGDVKMEME